MVKKKHLYNSKLGKVRWFVERFGVRELALKPLRSIFAPCIIPLLPKASFIFDGVELPYVWHRYNMTWASERGVEVPIARHFVASQQAGKVLEVGNVLSHYAPVNHQILDKFERATGVINEDILTFKPEAKFDLIISISTFEHIGFDDESESSSGEKITAAIEACRRMLTPSGKLVATVPIGYNPELDALLRGNVLPVEKESFMHRVGPHRWEECGKVEALQHRYKEPFPYANAIAVLQFRSST